MSMTIKMLDETGKGFRLVSVGEPVDIQVISGDSPRIVVHQAIASLSRGFPLVNNAYIMNAAGDTISKIDYKEVKSGQPGMGDWYREAFREGSATVDIPSLVGADPEKIIEAARAIFFNANPHLREQLAEAGLAPGGLTEVLKNAQEEQLGEEDCGTILAIFPGMASYGVYLGGEYVDVNALTARQIRAYTVYAKPEAIDDLRKTELIPETKLKLLAENEVKVNGKPNKGAVDTLKQYAGVEVIEQTPQQKSDYFKDLIFGRLEEGILDQAVGHILRNVHTHQIELAVEKLDTHETIYLLIDGRFSRSFTPGRDIIKAVDLTRDNLNELELKLRHDRDNYNRSPVKEKCRFYDARIVDNVLMFSPWIKELDDSVEAIAQDYAGQSLGLFAPLPEEAQKKAYEAALAMVHKYPANTIRGCIARTKVLGDDDLSERVILVHHDKLIIGFLKNTTINYADTRLTTNNLVHDSESIVWYNLNPGNHPGAMVVEKV